MKDIAALITDLEGNTWVARIFADSVEVVDQEAETQLAAKAAGIPIRKRLSLYETSPDGRIGQRRTITFYEDPVSKEVAYQDKEPAPLLEANKPVVVVEEPAAEV